MDTFFRYKYERNHTRRYFIWCIEDWSSPLLGMGNHTFISNKWTGFRSCVDSKAKFFLGPEKKKIDNNGSCFKHVGDEEDEHANH